MSVPTLTFGQVVSIDPRWRTCELVLSETGVRCANVPIMNHYVTMNSGVWDFHNLVRPPSEQLAGGYQPSLDARTTMAVVAMIGGPMGRPIVIGFVPHIMSQMHFVETEQNRFIHRHASGTLTTINKHGDYEFQHTGGAFVRVAFDNDAGPADRHQDLTPLCWNENWLLPENEPPTITVSVGNRDGEAFKARVRPNGDTDVYSSGNLTIRYAGNVHVDAGGNADIHVGGTTTLSSEGSITARTPADVTVTAGGSATVQAVGDASLLAGGSVTAAAAGSATVAAAGELTAAAGGNGTFGAAGTVTVGSGGPMTLAAPEITALTGALVVTGALIVLEQPETAVAGAAVGAAIGATGIAEGAAAAAAAPPEVAAAVADIAQMRLDVQAAVDEAVATSEPARGTGPFDNQGEPR